MNTKVYAVREIYVYKVDELTAYPNVVEYPADESENR